MVISSGDTFTENRLKIWFGGRCIDADDDHKELTVAHCNPDWVNVNLIRVQCFKGGCRGHIRGTRLGPGDNPLVLR